MPRSSHNITFESFDSLAPYWINPRYNLKWDCIFILPPWLEVWWREFGPKADLYLCVVKQKGTIIGFAPLLLMGEEARFIGSADVCDCLDTKFVGIFSLEIDLYFCSFFHNGVI